MKFKTLVLVSALFAVTSVWPKVDVSPLFVQLSDAMAESKQGKFAKSSQILTALQQDFTKISEQHSLKDEQVEGAIQNAIIDPNAKHLEDLAKALYRFEKAQNPVDHQAKHQDFLAKMNPLYAELDTAVKSKDIWKIKLAYREVGLNWVKQEKAVREISLKHYGQFEKILGLLRINLKEENPPLDKIEERVAELGKLMTDFNQFKIK
ncbi:Fe2+/Pb2+ permease [Mannheimia granulomatis]|uniref:Fe2+/Pb2+ permease n=1 Tax=Mannheimia granulomatis TaxID=85402 RepID=A0A6G8JHY9_9PAST|nr:Fe2+/Pb2+ permease [Mannheimia granulomatis]QIM66689.1 Fe2+/Pb2+ permease [Mannheimia granulomatis]